MIFDNMPYTNFHELNLDWLLKMMKELSAEVKSWTPDQVNAWLEEHASSFVGVRPVYSSENKRIEFTSDSSKVSVFVGDNFEVKELIVDGKPIDIADTVARNAASSAIATANTANTAANNATTKATNAQTSANVAQTTANTALSTANSATNTANKALSASGGNYGKSRFYSVVFIGASYTISGSGQTTTNIPQFIKSALGVPDSRWFQSTIAGTGFVAVSSGKKWATMLSDLVATMSAEQKAAVTDVIFVGGLNDSVKDQAEVRTAINDLLSYIRTTFGAGTISHLAHVGYTMTQGSHALIKDSIRTWKRACLESTSAHFLSGCENILHDTSLLRTENFNHPNYTTGQVALRGAILKALLFGSVSPVYDKDIALTPTSGWTISNATSLINAVMDSNATYISFFGSTITTGADLPANGSTGAVIATIPKSGTLFYFDQARIATIRFRVSCTVDSTAYRGVGTVTLDRNNITLRVQIQGLATIPAGTVLSCGSGNTTVATVLC